MSTLRIIKSIVFIAFVVFHVNVHGLGNDGRIRNQKIDVDPYKFIGISARQEYCAFVLDRFSRFKDLELLSGVSKRCTTGDL